MEYKGDIVGDYQLDFLVEEELIVEIKSVERLADVHRSQLITYLAVTNLELGLLINFNVHLLRDGIKRVVRGLPTIAPF